MVFPRVVVVLEGLSNGSTAIGRLVASIVLTESVNESEDGLDCVSSAVLVLLELAFLTGDEVVSTFGLTQGVMGTQILTGRNGRTAHIVRIRSCTGAAITLVEDGAKVPIDPVLPIKCSEISVRLSFISMRFDDALYILRYLKRSTRIDE